METALDFYSEGGTMMSTGALKRKSRVESFDLRKLLRRHNTRHRYCNNSRMSSSRKDGMSSTGTILL